MTACSDAFTSSPDPGDVLDGPIDGLTPDELAAFVEGDRQFGRPFAPADGLGPIFNNVSCAACHSADGRGRPENVLFRFNGLGGPQLQDRAIPGAVPEILPAGAAVSGRLPPPVFGVGLIEAIPEATILALADSLDADGDGISGRPNWVTPPPWVPSDEPGAEPGPRLGRFSRKGQVSTLLQQVTEAYHQDIGVTSDFLPVENTNPQTSRAAEAADRVPDPEIPAATIRSVLAYIRTLAPPAPGADTPERQRGRVVFHSVGCASCHVPVLMTGPSSIPALANRPVYLYSDLLLHDMGSGLADDRPDGSASGVEWKTPPLWGLRVMRDFLNGDAFLLHDGRARSIEEAILLHGGEAQGARDRFAALTPADRTAVLDFIGSR
ncbi:MAG: thiol oxidoreductase [Gemmatimonadetes bacterium]|nr:thiol oxidoreductase [Gemmatimonadota bacterium]MBI2403189.1 thiol oxidoreductase [Gemmatimonadota bacterium]